MTALPSLVAHADWSVSSSKRWIACAVLSDIGRYTVSAPMPVGEPQSLFARLHGAAGEGASVLAGFDFPIGLPEQYARKCAISNFLDILPDFGYGEWGQFYDVAASPEQIHLRRPFYPLRAGSARQAHLLQTLHVQTMDDLRRRCERRRPGRRAACPLFWTLGGQQVGKAAISGWCSVLAPALRSQEKVSQGKVSVWPFSGALGDLIKPGQTVIAECYPAESYTHLGLAFPTARLQPPLLTTQPGTGKRSQTARAANAPALRQWADRAGVILAADLQQAIRDGFGSGASGEDRFDALVGLFGVLNVVLGYRSPGELDWSEIRMVEGWILGQAVQNPV